MALAVLLVGCGPGRPDADSGRATLVQAIDSGSAQRLRLVRFEKTDGQTGKINGVNKYTMMFTADAAFVENAMYHLGSPLPTPGARTITTMEYSPPATSFSWLDFRRASMGFRAAKLGDQLHLSGSVHFEKRESGWVPVDLSLEAVHDSAGRVRMPPAPATAIRGTILEQIPGEYVGGWATTDGVSCADVTVASGTGWSDLVFSVFLFRCASHDSGVSVRLASAGEGLVARGGDPGTQNVVAFYYAHGGNVKEPGWHMTSRSELKDKDGNLMIAAGRRIYLTKRP